MMLKFFNKNWVFPVWVWIIILFFSLLKLWLMENQHLYALGWAGHDDRLFTTLANSLIRHHWLGSYNNLTLAKGPFYSIWVYFSYFVHIPLMLSQNVLYIFSCLLMTVSIKPLVKKNWQSAIIFLVLLFNPMSFSPQITTRVFREGIYGSLTLLVVASWIGLILRLSSSNIKRISKKNINLLVWSLGSGISLAVFWLTREEGIWIMPFIVMVLLLLFYSQWRIRSKDWKVKMIIAFFPFLILFSFIYGVSYINYRVYGVFTTVEFKSKDFLDAYGSLTRVKSDISYPNVPVTRETRLKIAKVSPSYAKISPWLDNPNNGWINNSTSSLILNKREIEGGWFMWAFRDAVAVPGFYSDGKTAMNFYRTMASEVNAACDEHKLNCLPKRSTMMSPWNNTYIKPTTKVFFSSWVFITKFDEFSASPMVSIGDTDSLKFFSKVTNEKIYFNSSSGRRIKILEGIDHIYRFVIPILFVVSLFLFFLNLFRRKNSIILWIALSIIVSISARILILSFITVSSFNSIHSAYFSPIYPLLSVVILLMIFSTSFKKEKRK